MSGDERPDGERLGTVARGAAWTFGGRFAKLALLFVVEVVMARLLGFSAYGGITLAAVAINLGTTLGGLGLDNGLARKLPLYERDPAKTRGALRAGIGLGLVGGLGVGGALFLAAPTLARAGFGDPGVAVLFRVVAVAIPFSVLTGLGVAIARSFGDATTHVAVRQLFVPVGKAVAIPALILAGFGVVGAAAGLAATVALGGVLALTLGVRRVPVSLTGPRDPMARELVAFSLPLMLASGLQFLLTNTDVVLVGAFLATGQVGVYNAALKVMNLGWLFFYPVTFLLGPALTRLDRDGRHAEATRTYQVSTKWMTLATLPVFLLLVCFPEVVLLATFGPGATGGATALRVLAVPVMFSVLLGANGGALVSFGHSRITMYVNAVALTLNLAGNLLLIPRFGIAGAAVATAVSLGVKNLLLGLRLYQWYGIHPFSAALVRSVGAVAVLSVPGYVLFVRLFAAGTLSVAALGVFFLALYPVVVVRAGAVEDEDVAVIDRFERHAGVDLDLLRAVVGRIRT